MKKEKLPEVEQVVLPNVLGMRPGKYILIALIVVILLLVFLLGILPGIISSGRYISFNSNLADVGIILDGKYIGSTEGSRIFVSSGKHNVEYIKNSEKIADDVINVDKPIFLTLLIKRTMNVDVPSVGNQEIYNKSLENTLYNIVSYSQVVDYSEFYNYPPLITNLAKDAVACNISDVSKEFFLLLNFITSDVLKADLDNALIILEQNNISYKTANFINLYNMLPDVLSSNLDIVKVSQKKCVNSPKKANNMFIYDEVTFEIGTDSYPNIFGINTYPILVNVKPFAVSESYVSEYDWALFIEANPYWAKSNITTLINDGMVDEYYLAGIFPSTVNKSTLPIRNISYNAALAYVTWLSDKTGEPYRLLSEAEYEVVAASCSDKPYCNSLVVVDSDSTLPKGVNGCLWEFTSTHYVPLARLSGSYEELTRLGIGDVIIKGGSYINNSSTVSPESVGVIEKNVTSEYTGFRVAKDI